MFFCVFASHHFLFQDFFSFFFLFCLCVLLIFPISRMTWKIKKTVSSFITWYSSLPGTPLLSCLSYRHSRLRPYSIFMKFDHPKVTPKAVLKTEKQYHVAWGTSWPLMPFLLYPFRHYFLVCFPQLKLRLPPPWVLRRFPENTNIGRERNSNTLLYMLFIPHSLSQFSFFFISYLFILRSLSLLPENTT